MIEWSDHNADGRPAFAAFIAEGTQPSERAPAHGTSIPSEGFVECRIDMFLAAKGDGKVANTPNQQNEKKPQADRDEEQRRQQQQQDGQNRQPGSEQRPDQGRGNPQQR